MSHQVFTKEELQSIRVAVNAAEEKSGGEIVPIFVPQSDYYEVAIWRSGFVFAMLATAILLAVHYATDTLLLVPLYFWIICILALGSIGAWITMLSPALKRGFAGKALLNKRVQEKALQMFTEHAVFNTEQRIGIMIFVSFFERQVFIRADDGISAVISDDAWLDVIGHLIEKLKRGEKVAALVGAIEECGNHVAESPIEIYHNDDNELDDGLKTVKDA